VSNIIQRTTRSQHYFHFSSYLLRKTAFICNIDRDWMIYHKHPIRSLFTSMLRKDSLPYPLDAYALSFFKAKYVIVLTENFINWISIRAPDKLRFYAMKTSKNACIIRLECTHYAYILLCELYDRNTCIVLGLSR
jgi:hypothetical protein